MSDSEGMVRLNANIAKELDAVLEGVAADMGTTKSEALRKGIILLGESHKAAKAGKFVGIANDEDKLDQRFIGL